MSPLLERLSAELPAKLTVSGDDMNDWKIREVIDSNFPEKPGLTSFEASYITDIIVVVPSDGVVTGVDLGVKVTTASTKDGPSLGMIPSRVGLIVSLFPLAATLGWVMMV